MAEAEEVGGPHVNFKIIVLLVASQQQQHKSSVPFSPPQQRVHAVTEGNSQPFAGLSSRLASGKEINKFDRQPKSNRAGSFVRSLKSNPPQSQSFQRLVTAPQHLSLTLLHRVFSRCFECQVTMAAQWIHNRIKVPPSTLALLLSLQLSISTHCTFTPLWRDSLR